MSVLGWLHKMIWAEDIICGNCMFRILFIAAQCQQMCLEKLCMSIDAFCVFIK